MELRQLRYFIQAAELLNFTEAAHMLYISQSTLSQQIKQLEDELDILLFDRVGKKVILTEPGSRFLTYARQTVKDADSGKQVVADLKELKTGSLRIGVTHGLTTMLTQRLISFSNQYPGIKIEVTFATSDELLEKLDHAGLDFVLCFRQAQENDAIVSYPLFESRLSWVVHPDHPMANKSSITIKQLANEPMVLPAKGFHTRRFLDDVFDRNNVVPNVKMEMNDINTLLQLVDTGKWSTILTMASVASHTSLVAVPIAGKDISRQASLTWPVNVYRKKAAIVFTDLLMR